MLSGESDVHLTIQSRSGGVGNVKMLQWIIPVDGIRVVEPAWSGRHYELLDEPNLQNEVIRLAVHKSAPHVSHKHLIGDIYDHHIKQFLLEIFNTLQEFTLTYADVCWRMLTSLYYNY